MGMGGGSYAMLIGNDERPEGAEARRPADREGQGIRREGQRKDDENTASNLQGLEGEERRTKKQELIKEMNESAMKAFGEFLKPEQITRLKQISYHMRGAMAFSDPEVAKKLNLTDSQKTEIQTISQESTEADARDLPVGNSRTTAKPR